jgi:hypothetical protein
MNKVRNQTVSAWQLSVVLYYDGGIDKVLTYNRSANSDQAKRKLDGRAEAKIIQIACGPVPNGYSKWSLWLLVEKCRVELEVPVSNDTIGRALKNQLRPHRNKYWCIPPKCEIELNVMTRQCHTRRIDNIDTLRCELSSWESKRNSEAAKINWRFRIDDSREKLISLYPKIFVYSDEIDQSARTFRPLNTETGHKYYEY